MAHECPECGQVCYCGSDIDDCLFNFPKDVDRCTHCDGEVEEDYDDYPPFPEKYNGNLIEEGK